MSVPVIAVEPAHDHFGESESKLSDEERKVLKEIRFEKDVALERIKVRTGTDKVGAIRVGRFVFTKLVVLGLSRNSRGR